MTADPLDQVLHLVAEGRLTADEAAPILAALDEAASASRAGAAAAAWGQTRRAESPGAFAFDDSSAFTDGGPAGSGAPTSLRIEVREGGRKVVNLRLPIAVGRFALDRVPGLSGEQVDRVREALRSGLRGPVLVVDDGDSGVRIVLE